MPNMPLVSEMTNGPAMNLDVPSGALRRAVNRMILRALPNAALFLVGYYLLMVLAHQWAVPPPVDDVMSVVAAVSAGLALALYAWLRRSHPADDWASVVGIGLGAIGLVNIYLHAYLTADPLQTTNLMLAMILVGLMIPDMGWFLVALGVYLTGWLSLIWLLPPSNLWIHLGFGMGFAAAVSILAHVLLFRAFLRSERLHLQSEQLLLNILPELIAERLKSHKEAIIADDFTEVTVLFADIVDFTPLSAGLAPREVVGLLNQVFSGLDNLADRYGLEKIKTIGDAYMVVGGAPLPRGDHAEAVAEMALHIQEVVNAVAPGRPFLQMRVGMHSGPVVAGVIGVRKFSYDLWGDTVNVASRMETHGVPERIQVSEEVHERLKDRYQFEPRGRINVKGRGEMMTYFLVGRRG